MAVKIPDYTALGNSPAPQPSLAVQAPSVSPVGAATARFGEALNQAGDKVHQYIDAGNEEKLAAAKSQFLQAQIQTQSDLQHDQDYATLTERYSKTVGSAYAGAMNSLQNPALKARFRNEIAPEFARGVAGIKQQAFGLATQYGNAATDETAQKNINLAAATPDPIARKKLLQSTQELYNARRDLGAMDPEAAAAKQRGLAVEFSRADLLNQTAEERVSALAPHTSDPHAPVSNVDIGAFTAAVKQQESGGQRYGADGKILTSSAGALGEMQVTPTTAMKPGFGIKPADPANPDDVARVGKEYLPAMLKHYNNDPQKAAAAYNAGPGAVDQAVASAKKAGDASQWLNYLPAETRDYVPKVMANYAKAAPAGAQGEAPTTDVALSGTAVDLLPMSQRQEMLTASAKEAVLNRAQTDPQGAMALTQRPEYAKALGPSLPEVQEQVRTAFKNQDDKARADRAMAAVGANKEAWDQMLNGTLTQQGLTRMQANGQISNDAANYMRQQMAQAIPLKSPPEIAANLMGFNERLSDLVTRSNGKLSIHGTAEELLDFQRDVMKAAATGDIAQGDANTLMKQVNPAVDKRAKQADGGMFSYFDTPYEAGYRAIKTWMGDDESRTTADKAETMRRFVYLLESQPDPSKVNRQQAGAFARQAIESYARDKFPVLSMMDELPNAVINTTGLKTQVTPQSTAKADASVNTDGKVMVDGKGNYARVYSDGHFEELSAEEVKRLRAGGH